MNGGRGRNAPCFDTRFWNVCPTKPAEQNRQDFLTVKQKSSTQVTVLETGF